jgi:hypothetical protein
VTSFQSRSKAARKRYVTCHICGNEHRIRKDGKFPVHRNPRGFKYPSGKQAICMGSEVTP